VQESKLWAAACYRYRKSMYTRKIVHREVKYSRYSEQERS
jgi:hypothetical protein